MAGSDTDDAHSRAIMGAHLAVLTPHMQMEHMFDPMLTEPGSVPVVRDAVPRAAGATVFRIYCTDFLNSAPTFSPANAYLANATGAQNTFTRALHNGFFTCVQPSSSSLEIYSLDSTDELLQRLQATSWNGSHVQSFSLRTTLQPNSGQTPQLMEISEFKATIAWAGAEISFSSADTPTVCGFPASDASISAFVGSRNLLSLGVSSPIPVSAIKLSDLLDLHGALRVVLLAFKLIDLPLQISGAPGSRTSYSIQPGTSYRSWLRLELVPNDATWNIGKTLEFLRDLAPTVNFTKQRFILRHQSQSTRDDTRFTVTHEHSLISVTDIAISNLQFTAWCVFGQSPTLNLCFTKEQSVDTILEAILGILNSSGNPNPTQLSKDDIHPHKLLDNVPLGTSDSSALQFYIHQMSVSLNPGSGTSSKASYVSFQILIEIDLFGSAFLLSINGFPIRMTATLWTHTRDPAIYGGTGATGSSYLPYIEDYMQIQPFGDNVSGVIDLAHIIGKDNASSIPLGIDAQSTKLTIEIEKTSTTTTVAMNTLLVCTDDTTQTDTNFPHLRTGTLSFSASLSRDSSTGVDYDVILEANLLLFDVRTPPPANITPPAALGITIEVDDGTWTVSATANALQFGALYEIMDKSAQESVVDILGHLEIPSLSLVYTYAPKQASTLLLNGSLVVGPLELELLYAYTGKSSDGTAGSWSIQAHLGLIDDVSHKLVDIVKGIDESLGDFLEEVPFVRDCAIPAVGQVSGPNSPASQTAYEHAPLRLFATSNNGITMVGFRMEIDTPAGAISCMVVRWKNTNHVASDGKTRTSPKVLLKVALDKIPSLPNIPVVGSLPQPVDSIDYVFVNDPDQAGAGATAPAGITLTEMATINDILQENGFDTIPFRQVQSSIKSDNANSNPSISGSGNTSSAALAVSAGHHLMVVADQKTILDHRFGSSPSPKTPVPASSKLALRTKVPMEGSIIPTVVSKKVVTFSPRSNRVVKDVPTTNVKVTTTTNAKDASQADSGTTHGTLKKSFEPLSVSNFGVQLKNGYLYLVLDFTIALGPVRLTVIGVSVLKLHSTLR